MLSSIIRDVSFDTTVNNNRGWYELRSVVMCTFVLVAMPSKWLQHVAASECVSLI